jgi:hypothetical protein
MADAMSDYLEEALMKHIFRNTALSCPANIYVALYTVAPTDAGGGTEVSGTAYARQAVNTTTGWSAPAATSGGYQTDNAAAIEFPVAGSDWTTIVAVGLLDANSPGGNLLFYGNLTSPQACGSGSQVKFAIGALDVRLGS